VTIRTRITALATATVLVVLLLAGFAVVRVHERLLVEAVDERLEQAADDAGRTPTSGTLRAPGDDDSVAQLVRDGAVVAVAPATAKSVLTAPIAPAPGRAGAVVVRDVPGVLEGEGTHRVRSVVLPDATTLHLAINLDDVRESTDALRRALAAAIPLVTVVLGAVIWWFVGRAILPVEAIRAQVSAIGPDDLDRRVPVPEADDEIAQLAQTMNGMLDRLERSAGQQRRLVADASHELRSPLARMRAELEVDLAHPDGADLVATHRSALEEVVGLQRLVDDLLDLARPDGVGPSLRSLEPVDLDDLVLRAARRVRDTGRVTLATSEVGAVQVIGEAPRLERMVANLLDNAVRHAATAVTVGLHDHGDGMALLVVDDDGPGIPPADRARVVEPFTRLDAARAAGSGGAGLGLAIVQEIAAAHGGSLAITDRPGGGARFVVTLPMAGPG
jgi:signal transduction histidine kinase